MARQIKTSQKIRVIVNGVIVYTKVGAVSEMFGHTLQRMAVLNAIEQIALGDAGRKITGFVGRFTDIDVQVDLL